MRAALTIGTLILASGAAQAAPDAAFPIGPGTEIFWVSAYDGGSDRFYESLIAEQGDVQIFRTNSDYSEGGPSDHFALVSGIYYVGCDMEMPSDQERAAVAGLWPLTSGDVVEIESGDGAKFETGDTTEFYLMGRTYPAHVIKGTYYGDEESEEMLTVLDEVKLTVGIKWDEGGTDSAVLVTKPDAVASTTPDTDLIGTCADLLNTETNEN
ncbi:MAG: hypothetical protein NXH72_05820 [Hyphomonadaceae bacterium]|nr:hypothetical protein [Hyphomonadaceae bacterium]